MSKKSRRQKRPTIHTTLPTWVYLKLKELREKEGTPIWQLIAVALRLRERNPQEYFQLLQQE